MVAKSIDPQFDFRGKGQGPATPKSPAKPGEWGANGTDELLARRRHWPLGGLGSPETWTDNIIAALESSATVLY